MHKFSHLRVQNLGSSELSLQSLNRSQNFIDGMQFPFEHVNSESEHPIDGSLTSSLYAAAVPRTSPYSFSEWVCPSTEMLSRDSETKVFRGVFVVDKLKDVEIKRFSAVLFRISIFSIKLEVFTATVHDLFMKTMISGSTIQRGYFWLPRTKIMHKYSIYDKESFSVIKDWMMKHELKYKYFQTSLYKRNSYHTFNLGFVWQDRFDFLIQGYPIRASEDISPAFHNRKWYLSTNDA